MNKKFVGLLITFLILGFMIFMGCSYLFANAFQNNTILPFLFALAIILAAFVAAYYFSGVILGEPVEVDETEEEQPTSNIQYFYHGYSEGFCKVERLTFQKGNKVTADFNFLNKEGNYISEKWYNAVSDFSKDGIALVYDGEMYNFINTEGAIVSNTWFYDIDPFNDGVAKVTWKDNTVNFVKVDGTYLWKDWRPEIVLPKKEDNNQ